MTATLTRVSGVALVIAAAAGGPFVVRAQQATTPPDVLVGLLVEVRGLRAAMEQMASAGPRVQLALGESNCRNSALRTRFDGSTR